MNKIKTLKEIRKQAGLTQEQLAEKSGYCVSSIKKHESGKNSMRIKTIVDLSDVLNIPESFLFYDQVNKFRIESERSVKDSPTHLATEFEIVGYEVENIFMRMAKYKIDTEKYSELKELYNKRYRKLMQIKYSLDKAMKIQLNHFKKKSKSF